MKTPAQIAAMLKDEHSLFGPSGMNAIFRRELGRFTPKYPHLIGTRLGVSEKQCSGAPCSDRDYAWCVAGVVWMSKRALTLPRDNIIGLIRHELGHLALRGGGGERDADDVAEDVTGDYIRYDSRDVQTVGRGNHPRPSRLPR